MSSHPADIIILGSVGWYDREKTRLLWPSMTAADILWIRHSINSYKYVWMVQNGTLSLSLVAIYIKLHEARQPTISIFFLLSSTLSICVSGNFSSTIDIILWRVQYDHAQKQFCCGNITLLFLTQFPPTGTTSHPCRITASDDKIQLGLQHTYCCSIHILTIVQDHVTW